MSDVSQGSLLFGDLLARARRSWVNEMASRLTNRGFSDYRASDALALRLLRHGPLPFARFTKRLGSSRQAARKVIDGLVARDFATLGIDATDARRRVVELTLAGDRYASVVVDVIEELNAEVMQKVDPATLASTREVLAFLHASYGASSPVHSSLSVA